MRNPAFASLKLCSRFVTIFYCLALLLMSFPVHAINPDAPPSLKTIRPPTPPELVRYVKNKNAAIRLGKAFFWDMQVGSDGIQACGSCHSNAGADNRIKNTLNPGSPSLNNTKFDLGGPNYTLQLSDFPFHLLKDPNNRQSKVLRDIYDVVSSQGVFKYNYIDINYNSSVDYGQYVYDPVFNVRGINVRQVEPRQAPTIFNAVFNFRNFWDGRAFDIFNGETPFGPTDDVRIFRTTQKGGIELVPVNLQFSSLASQAVAPPVGNLEMSYNGRTFPDIGVKMLAPEIVPLGKQHVDPTDSVLGCIANCDTGLSTSYERMIQDAFRDEFWDSNKIVEYRNGKTIISNGPPTNTNQYTIMEANFSLFWGIAIQMYESTLISDDTPFDRYQEGNDNALTAQQRLGLNLFLTKGNCIQCHATSLFSEATTPNIVNPDGSVNPIGRTVMVDGTTVVYDEGFFNTGVRPTKEDIAIGGTNPSGFPLSFSRRATVYNDPVRFTIDPPAMRGDRIAVDGAFKVPSLRNVELTGPYFHNGGQATLEQVLTFYNRGGDFRDQNARNVSIFITNLGLTDAEKAAIIAFLKSLTDERVRYQRAPFDHPEIFIPDGQVGNNKYVVPEDSTKLAQDHLIQIRAVGAKGSRTPLKPFVEQF